jgi:hypothetical protein
MSDKDYHLRELEIARSPSDSRRVMPPVLPGIRRVLDIGCDAGQTLIAADMGGAYKTGITLSSREWHCPICIFQPRSAKRLASLLQMHESGLSCTRCPCCPGSETCCRFGEQHLDCPSA